MQAFSLAPGEKKFVSIPNRDNCRIYMTCNGFCGLALNENDAVGTSGRYFTFSNKLNDHPFMINPPLLLDGQSLWFFEPTGGTSTNVSIWITAGV